MGGALLILKGYGQQITPLTIGDTVLDITLNNIVNYKATTARLSDFKGKLLVLDFWGIWCTACINIFPHNNELQRQYGGKLQVLNVAFEPEAKIKPFITNLEKRRGAEYRITSITGDTLLQQLFPHRTVPHLVWIGPDGVVKAITSATRFTKENIDKILGGETASFQQKKDINMSKPAFLPSVITDSPFSMVHYSLLVNGDFYDGAGTAQHIFKTGDKAYGLNYTNQTLDYICFRIGMAMLENSGAHPYYNPRLYKVEIKNAQLLKAFKETIWQYAFFLPKNETDSFYYKALKEISCYTDYYTGIEKRKMPCLVLTLNGTKEKFATKGGDDGSPLFSTDSSKLINQPMYVFTNLLNDSKFTELPVIDETGYNGNIDIQLNAPYTLQSITKQLQQQGLSLTPAQRELDIVVVKDKNR